MKLIIYGLGQIFERYKEIIPIKKVEAFVDKKASDKEKLFDIPVIPPSELNQYEFDYIIVFSNKYFYQIQEELINVFFIPKEKILSWRIILRDGEIINNEVKKYIVEHIEAFKESSVIEFGLDMMYGVISPTYGILRSDLTIDGIGDACFPYEKSFYDNILTDLVRSPRSYDIAIVKPGMLTRKIAADLKQKNVSSIIVIEKYKLNDIDTTSKMLEQFFPNRVKKTYMSGEVIFEIVQNKNVELDCIDYVVTHKKYMISQNDLYKGLCVGNFRMEGFLSELDGQSISKFNDRANETTALYWIWKNTSSKYVGLSHYRRFFYNNSFRYEINRLNKDRIKEILYDKKYDIILSELKYLDWSIYENINKTVGTDYNFSAYSLFFEEIKNKQPKYLDAFEDVIHNNRMYICNMFVTRREILNEYCEWLFSFYLNVLEKLDVSEGSLYQKRTAGYYSEIFWTVWILMQNYKVFELPLTDVYAIR